MRLVTFNILHGQRVADLVANSEPAGPLAEPIHLQRAITDLRPDILAMQEVDAGQARSAHVDQTWLAAQAMGITDPGQHSRFVPAVSGTPGHRARFVPASEALQQQVRVGQADDLGPLYGVSLISRSKVSRWAHQTLMPPPITLPLLVADGKKPAFKAIPDEPRVAIAAVIETEQGPITVATAHLSFVPGVNVMQLRRTHKWLADWPRPLILLGDFNMPGSLPERITGLPGLVTQATYPSFEPRIRFDHVLVDGFTTGDIELLREQTRTKALTISDHLAIVVELPFTTID